MTDENTKKISIIYSKSKDYRVVAATGVWGGVSPQGEIVCNFFVEMAVEPGKMEMTIDDAGKVVKEDEINKVEKLFNRELQVGVLMRPDIAKTIGKWLIDQSEKMSPLLNQKKH